MGTIIGEGITFDDVLLVPAYSEGNSESGRCSHVSDQKDQTEHSDDECRNGYRYRTPHGDCNGKTGWYRYHSQKYVHRGTGR